MPQLEVKPAEDTAQREIVISRVINAPRERVWDAWTDPRQVVNWWGPRGFTTTIQEMDVRPTGVWRQTMHGPDGTDYFNKSEFVEVEEPERIYYSHGGGKRGGPGVQFQATWTFEAENDKTKVTIQMVFPTAQERNETVRNFRAIEGAKQTLERLEEYLSTRMAAEHPFVITRTFDAPRDLVWKAWTERDRLKQWFGPKGFTMTNASLDFRPGGKFHYCLRSPDGKEMWGKFIYRDITAPERIVLVNSFSDAKSGVTRHPLSPTWPLEMISTTTFAEREGKTTVTVEWYPLNATEEERKTFDSSHSGMQQGWGGTFDQLAEYLKKG